MNRIRLHLGCGLVHRPGWINVDRYRQPAADVRADAGLLPFADGSVEVIEAFQLVEHLGYVGTFYALCEWARLLAASDLDASGDGGALRIETPDREATLRAVLTAETQEAALPWLFGSEQEGQGHRYLFSADELAGMARTAGFEFVVVKAAGGAARPALRLTARRGANTHALRFRINVHRALVTSGAVAPFHAAHHAAALETLCDRAVAWVDSPGSDSLMALFSLAVRYSPAAAACVLDSLPDPAAWPPAELVDLRRLAVELAGEEFVARLACRWRRQSKLPGTAGAAWAALEREVSLYLAARITPDASLTAIRARFDAATSDLLPSDSDLDLFTRDALRELARRTTAQGVRSFCAGDLRAAGDAFEAALGYDVDSLWARWNFARLHLRQDRPLDALTHYEALRAGLPPVLTPSFEREMDAVSGRSGEAKSYAVPMADPADLLERPV